MAEKPKHTYESIMKSLQDGQYAPIYILMGEEAFFIDKIADYIAAHAIAPEARDFDQTVVFGADVTAAQVADMLRELPLMSQRKVVIVKEAQGLRSTEALDRYAERPAPQSVLVLCHKNGTIDRRKKLVARADARGIVFESKKKRDYELPVFITTYLKQHSATIEQKAAQMVADHVGADLNRLTGELDKALIALPKNDRRITPEVVERTIGVSKDFNAFELKDAIIRRDVVKANRIVNYFDKNPKAGSVFSFIPLIFSYFQNLMLAYYAPNPNDERSVAAHLGLRYEWGAKDYVAGMRNYSGRKTMQIITMLRKTDARSKGLDNPSTPPGDLMRELLFFILH